MLCKDKIELKPIGFVRTEAVGNEVKDRCSRSRIILHKHLTESLDGIAGFSHLLVLFWMDRISSEDRKTVKVHPRGRIDMPPLGVFATRTPQRPNPVGLTLVEILKVEDNVLTVEGLDAFDGTPVLDIKPYDYRDMARKVRVPEWWKKLEENSPQKRLHNHNTIC